MSADIRQPARTNLASSAAGGVTGTLPLANGGTAATTKAAAFDSLSPMTTGADLIYGGASGTGTRLANGSAGQFLKSAGGTSAPTWAALTSTNLVTNATATTALSASNVYHQWTSGNSLSLTTGTWDLQGLVDFNNTGVAAYTYREIGWFGANGAGTGTTPTKLSATANITLVSPASDTNLAGVENRGSVTTLDFLGTCIAPVVRITCAATVTVYLNTYATCVAANTGVTVYCSARQVS